LLSLVVVEVVMVVEVEVVLVDIERVLYQLILVPQQVLQ
jgi:hypothetical protein